MGFVVLVVQPRDKHAVRVTGGKHSQSPGISHSSLGSVALVPLGISRKKGRGTRCRHEFERLSSGNHGWPPRLGFVQSIHSILLKRMASGSNYHADELRSHCQSYTDYRITFGFLLYVTHIQQAKHGIAITSMHADRWTHSRGKSKARRTN